jgi:hypothetical protein
MVLLVEVAQRHRIRQELIEIGHAALTNLCIQRDRKLGDLAKGLILPRVFDAESGANGPLFA